MFTTIILPTTPANDDSARDPHRCDDCGCTVPRHAPPLCDYCFEARGDHSARYHVGDDVGELFSLGFSTR